MATRISQQQLNKFISPEAAMAPYERAQQTKMRQMQDDAAMEREAAGNEAAMGRQVSDNDARLAQLIRGKEMDEAGRMSSDQRQHQLSNEAIEANIARAKQIAAEAGMQRGKYSLNFSEKGGSANPESDPFAVQQAQGLRQAQITGYNITDPTVLPTPKDAEEIKNATGNLKALQSSGAATKQALEGADFIDRFGAVKIPFTDKVVGSSKGIDLESKITDMKMQQKELYALGALSGPDMGLIDDAFGRMTGIGSMIGGKERGIEQVDAILARAKKKLEGQATSRGYSPQPGFLGSNQPIKPEGSNAKYQDPEFQAYKAKRGYR